MKLAVKPSTPKLDAMVKQLGPDGRVELNTAAAYSLWADARAHLKSYAATHHATADRLNATRTGHFEDAATNMGWGAGADVGYVEVTAPGIGRVFRDLEIRPIKAQALTIPIHAIAYGRRVAEVRRSHAVFQPRKAKGEKASYLATTDDDGNIIPLYVLVRSATVPQDRTILPSDEAMTKSVANGLLTKIKDVLERSANT